MKVKLCFSNMDILETDNEPTARGGATQTRITSATQTEQLASHS